MLSRLSTAAALALLGVLAMTGTADAADLSERDQVMIGTAAVAGGLMLLLLVFYMIRHSLGLDRMPPADPDLDHHEASLPATDNALHGDHGTEATTHAHDEAVPTGSTSTSH